VSGPFFSRVNWLKPASSRTRCRQMYVLPEEATGWHASYCLHIIVAASMVDTDIVFKALADESRRMLLDRLHAKNGQTSH